VIRTIGNQTIKQFLFRHLTSTQLVGLFIASNEFQLFFFPYGSTVKPTEDPFLWTHMALRTV